MPHRKRPNLSGAAFTLIELLIVVAIIAILAAIAVPNFLEAQTRAKVTRAKADERSMATAIESYFVDNNACAPDQWFLTTPVSYIAAMHKDDPFGCSEPIINARNRALYVYVPAEKDSLFDMVLRFQLNYPSDRVDIINEARWFLASRGPDRLLEGEKAALAMSLSLNYYNPMFLGVLSNGQAQAYLSGTGVYDPTNGTTSAGDIGRNGFQGIIDGRPR